MSGSIYGFAPLQFVHILDLNTNITRLETGPKTLALKSNERVTAGPLPMIVVKPGHYCVIKDPCCKYIPGFACELRLGQTEIKFHSDPFPLYPGESLVDAADFLKGNADYSKAVKKLPVIKANYGIRLYVKLDFEDELGKHYAGDTYQLEGPLTYKPRPEVDVREIVEPVIVRSGTVLKIKATQEFTDRDGTERVTAEEWMVTKEGAYLPDVFEQVVSVEKKITLTPDCGIHLYAVQSVTDQFGRKRLAGESWLLTGEDVNEYPPEIGVEVRGQVNKMVLWKGQYAVIENVVDKKGKPQLGKRELRVGPCSFFMHPHESLEKGKVQDAYVMGENQALILTADEEFKDKMFKNKLRRCGDRWMIQGPLEYIPPIEVSIVKKRAKIPLSKNEGIYVQDWKTGQVRTEMGPMSYMLTENEELWCKELPGNTENLLKQGGGGGGQDIRKMAYFEQSIDPHMLKGRDKTRLVTYRCPGNTAVQVYNYLEKTARVVFGPDLVILGAHENFNVLSLSAGKPKKSDALQSLCLMLGPDFISDIIEVETSDHARLRIQLAFNNHFEYTIGDKESEARIFSVPDFIGFACRQLGARIRGAVAQVTFDEFHRHSASVIQASVFGLDESGNLKSQLKFPANNLVISSIDIQSIEPVDIKMRDSLSRSVQLAIEISTKSIEAAASHEAARNEQIAQGELERQKLTNEKESEKERAKLLELQAIASAVESTGQAKAEAQAQAERMIIECESEIEAARLKAEAEEIEHYAKLEAQAMLRSEELSFTKNQNNLEIYKEREMSNIETSKFKKMIDAIGADVLAAIATSGPETQVKMLSALGLDSVLITDGNSPINLFQTAKGLIGEPMQE